MTTFWQTRLIKPPRLKRGDRVAVVSPCWGGAAAYPLRYEAGKRQLASLFDLDIVEMPHTCADADWLDRNPKARAEDLMAAFADTSVTAVIASIGGDDTDRLIPYLDLEVARRNPKIFLGYSDTTVLSMGLVRVLDEAGLPDLPVLSNLDFGHTDPIFTLPYGVQAEIDCDAGSLTILETAVT